MILYLVGGCHSGKSTFAAKLKSWFKDYVVSFDEEIRKTTDLSIDDLRKDAQKYFSIQLDIIKKKIDQEALAIAEDRINPYKNLYIFDRSLADSYFYYTFYVDKSQLSEEQSNEYDAFLKVLRETMPKHIGYENAKIFYFEPLSCEDNTDKMRPKTLCSRQSIESMMIYDYLKMSVDNSRKINRVNAKDPELVSKFVKVMRRAVEDYIKNLNPDWAHKAFEDYKQYSKIVENDLFTFDNILMNTYGAIDIEVGKQHLIRNAIVFSALLYTIDDLKGSIDSVINDIKNIEVEPEYMNSRCYPTGLFIKNNIMIVGEAPGMKGRSVEGYDLKPSFVYTQTSSLLRTSIYKMFPSAYCVPYITNLCKFARPENKVTNEDFSKCTHIFLNELNILRPRAIIALGNNVYEYFTEKAPEDLREIFSKFIIVKLMHPAGAFYKGYNSCDVNGLNEYDNLLKRALEDVNFQVQNSTEKLKYNYLKEPIYTETYTELNNAVIGWRKRNGFEDIF
jgi:uracil-DNA glycosylase family 4